MKKFISLILLLVLPAILMSQSTTLTVNSHYIKLERTGLETQVMYTKDINFGYDNLNLLFATKLSNGGWEFKIPYSGITSYNSVAKTNGAFPAFAVMKSAIQDSITLGKVAGSSAGGSGGSTDVSALNKEKSQRTRIYQGSTDSLRMLALQVKVDSLNLLLKTIKARTGSTVGGASEASLRTLIWQKHNTDSVLLSALKPLPVRLYAEVVKTGAVTPYPANTNFGDTTHMIILSGAARSSLGGGWIESIDIVTNNTTWAGAVVTAIIYDSIVPAAWDHHLYTKQYTTKQKRHKVAEVPVTLKAWSTSATSGDSAPDCVGGYVAMGTLGNARYQCAVGTNLYVVLVVTTPVGTSVSAQRMSVILMTSQD